MESFSVGINVVVDANEPADDEDEDDSKAWYREEELHQTEEDLKELEADNSHTCHFCKQPFPLRAILLQHLVTCRASTGNTGNFPDLFIQNIILLFFRIDSNNCSEEKQ